MNERDISSIFFVRDDKDDDKMKSNSWKDNHFYIVAPDAFDVFVTLECISMSALFIPFNMNENERDFRIVVCVYVLIVTGVRE